MDLYAPGISKQGDSGRTALLPDGYTFFEVMQGNQLGG